jgi:hypothetical protein
MCRQCHSYKEETALDTLLYILFAAAEASAGFLAPGKNLISAEGTQRPILAQQGTEPSRQWGKRPEGLSSPGGDIKKREERLPEDALLPGNPPGRYVIVPSGWEDKGISMKAGCWAQVYDEDGLTGDALTIMGPIDIKDVGGGGPFGIEWKDRISSIETGKRAEMIIYENANLNDPLVRIGPGQKANINNAIRTFGEIRSLKINCAK